MPYPKGKSGNPGGRPKAIVDVMELARKRSKKNIENLSYWADQTDDGAIAVRASIALHEIAWGKPAQNVGFTPEAGDTLSALISSIRSGNATG